MRQHGAHHRAAHHQPCRFALEPGKIEQVGGERADRRQDVPRLPHGAAVDRHDAPDQRFAEAHRAMHGGGGAHVVHDYADIGGAAVRWHFLPGQCFDELPVGTHRVARRHRAHLDLRKACGGAAHGGDGLGLVVLDADQRLARAGAMQHQAHPIDHVGGPVAHDAVVAGEIGFAFAAVDDQRVDLAALAERQLDRRRKGGAAQPDHAGRGDQRRDLRRCQRERIGRNVGLECAVVSIGFKGDGLERQARRMRRGDLADGDDPARCRRMHGRGNAALRFGDQLAFQHLLTDQHHRAGRLPDVLQQRHVKPRRQGQGTQRRIGGRALVIVRMHTPTRGSEYPQGCAAPSPPPEGGKETWGGPAFP